MLGFFLWVVFALGNNIIKENQNRKWPHARGTILSSDIEVEILEEWSHDEYTLSTYFFLMSYEYVVNNEVYIGHQITSYLQGYLQPFIPSILKWRYPKNKEVEVIL